MGFLFGWIVWGFFKLLNEQVPMYKHFCSCVLWYDVLTSPDYTERFFWAISVQLKSALSSWVNWAQLLSESYQQQY